MIALLGVLTYWNSFGLPLVFDDRTAIARNETIRQLSSLSQVLTPPQNTPVAGRPVINLSFALNYALSGLDPTSYHVWNVGVHIACALLLFALVRHTLLTPRARPRSADSSGGIALVAALVWMLHPLQTEAVDYLTQRSESMMALFFLLTLYCAARAHRSPPGWRWTTAAVVACGLGMASKESMVVAPLVVLLYDRLFEYDSTREAMVARWPLYAGLAATWLLLAALMWSGPRSGSVGFAAGVGVGTYMLNQLDMIVHYLRLAFWPQALVVYYGAPRPVAIADVLMPGLIVAALLVTTVIALVRWPRAGFLGAAFFLILAPTSSLVPIVTEVGAERRMYLPLAALTVLLVVGGWRAVERLGDRWRERARAIAVVAACLAVVVLGALAARTRARTAEYASSVALWRTVVERRPSPEAHHSLAVELKNAGDREQAMVHLKIAAPDYPEAEYGIGAELFDQQAFDPAIEHLRTFVRHRPDSPEALPARDMIGRALLAQGRLDQAVEEFRSILAAAPTNGDVHGNLADVLFAQRRWEEAIDHFRVFLALRSSHQNAWTKLGIALATVGRLDEAVECFQRLAQLDPRSVDARKYLAKAFLAQGKHEPAEVHAREALRLSSSDAEGHDLLGFALAAQGKLDEAIDEFRRALAIDPNDPRAREELAHAMRLKNAGRSR